MERKPVKSDAVSSLSLRNLLISAFMQAQAILFCFMLGSALDYAMHMQVRSNILRGEKMHETIIRITHFGEYRISRGDVEKLQLKLQENEMTPDYKAA